MKNTHLRILLERGHYPLQNCLEALTGAFPSGVISLYCLCADSKEADAAASHLATLQWTAKIAESHLFTFQEFPSAHKLANHLFLAEASSDFLFFLSSNILPEKNSLMPLIEELNRDVRLAGVNPWLSAAWLDGAEKRAAFMGITLDYQKRLHYLYEGALAGGGLLRKRYFQLAHPGSLLLRQADFYKAGGFQTELGFLALPTLCLALHNFRGKGFACLPNAAASLLYKFDSWDFCDLWNSILQRGRLNTENLRSDYPDFCQADNLAYACGEWLWEGPANIPDVVERGAVRSWQEWRYRATPESLIAYLASLPDRERFTALELARNRPACLPQTLRYYAVQSEKILERTKNKAIVKELENWRKKIRRFHYGSLKPGIELLKKAGLYECSLDCCPAVFCAWVEIAENFETLESGDDWPEIAVVMPVWNPDLNFFQQAVDSVRGQSYPKWQLCLADDASTDPVIQPFLEHLASRDKRLKVTYRPRNGHICHATNSALKLVTAPFTAFMDQDDLLAPHALAEVAAMFAQNPNLGYVYSDDDRIDENNVRRNPVFKPDFDRDLFYTGHLSTFATALIREADGLRPGLEGAQDRDLQLRVTEKLECGQIGHIPKILYHWRVHEGSTAATVQAKPYVLESSRRALLDAASRCGLTADELEIKNNKFFSLLYRPAKGTTCTVILLETATGINPALAHVLKKLGKEVKLDILIQPLRENTKVTAPYKILPFAGADYAQACNSAVCHVRGEIALFLDAALVPDQECRLDHLTALAQRPHIAMAGASLWRGERLVNGGWYPNVTGSVFQLLRGMERQDAHISAWGQMMMPRHVLGVPLPCMAVKREYCANGLFLDENMGELATVDFALKAWRHNMFTAISPWVNWQVERITAQPDERQRGRLLAKWQTQIAKNGIRNPNLKAAHDNDWTLIL